MRFFLCGLTFLSLIGIAVAGAPWQRHVIDDSLRGADGVRLADFNGDGLPDVVTGWEESGAARLYLHPGYELAKQPWPAVTVGEGLSPEDAVACDFDSDGRLDVISCHEGSFRRALVHFNRGGELLDEDNWETVAIEPLDGQRWMFAHPAGSIDGSQAIVFGSKGNGASISLLTVAKDGDPRDRSSWTVKRLRDAGWIMSLRMIDMDDDGDLDVVYSDRKGPNRGVGWLERPDDAAASKWKDHVIGGGEHEVMFIDADRDRLLVSTRNSVWLDFRRDSDGDWKQSTHANPDQVPNGKAILRLADRGLVMTANTDASKKVGRRVGVWYSQDGDVWIPISSTESVKLDRIECLDLDNDGDLDVMTCEERQNQGVIWYENPERTPKH